MRIFLRDSRDCFSKEKNDEIKRLEEKLEAKELTCASLSKELQETKMIIAKLGIPDDKLRAILQENACESLLSSMVISNLSHPRYLYYVLYFSPRTNFLWLILPTCQRHSSPLSIQLFSRPSFQDLCIQLQCNVLPLQPSSQMTSNFYKRKSRDFKNI